MVALVEPKSSPNKTEKASSPRRSHPCSPKTPYPRFSRVRSGHRLYKPETGTWMSRDPLGEASGLNLLAVFENNPICSFDKLGLQILVTHVTEALRALEAKEDENLIEELILGEENRNALVDTLVQLCSYVPSIKPVNNRPQCCRMESCKEQAEAFATAYIAEVTRIRMTELQDYGNILGGNRGNTRRQQEVDEQIKFLLEITETMKVDEEKAAEMRKRYKERWSRDTGGRQCGEWARIAKRHLESSLRPFYIKHELCFRGALVDESVGPDKFEHQWMIIYAPSLTELTYSDRSASVVHIDPWKSAGKKIVRKSRADRFTPNGTIFW
jgi:hypothetical protein